MRGRGSLAAEHTLRVIAGASTNRQPESAPVLRRVWLQGHVAGMSIPPAQGVSQCLVGQWSLQRPEPSLRVHADGPHFLYDSFRRPHHHGLLPPDSPARPSHDQGAPPHVRVRGVKSAFESSFRYRRRSSAPYSGSFGSYAAESSFRNFGDTILDCVCSRALAPACFAQYPSRSRLNLDIGLSLQSSAHLPMQLLRSWPHKIQWEEMAEFMLVPVTLMITVIIRKGPFGGPGLKP
jgi:hypothetical protein